MSVRIWRGFRLDLPEDWEMLRFSRDSSAGVCQWADRYSFRFEFDWRRVAGPPDMGRVLSDYVNKLKSEERVRDPLRAASAPGWEGFEGEVDGIMSSRFGRYYPAESCLVEAVFLWPDGRREPGLEHSVLASIAACGTERKKYRRWREFGMDLLAEEENRLDECEVKPAYVRMLFRSERGAPADRSAEERFERLGLVKIWMTVGPERWMEGKVPAHFRITGRKKDLLARHEVHTLSAEGRWKFRKAHYSSAAWVCPGDGRLYHASLSGLSSAIGSERLFGGRLYCCGDAGKGAR